VGEYLPSIGVFVTPDNVDEVTLDRVIPISEKRGTSKRHYFRMLGELLMDPHGNSVVRRTRFTRRFSKETRELRRLTALARDEIFQRTPPGIERVVLALMTQG
jgi:hypothetical protein